jgi:sec-independent protein translocase protein TatA
MAGLRGWELLLIFGVIMLLFGGSRLPQLGSSLGSAIRNFKRGFSGEEKGEGDVVSDDAKKLGDTAAANVTSPEKAAQKQA